MTDTISEHAGVGGVGRVACDDDAGRGGEGCARDAVVRWWVTHVRRFVRHCLDVHFVYLTCFLDLVLSEDQLLVGIVSCRVLVASNIGATDQLDRTTWYWQIQWR